MLLGSTLGDVDRRRVRDLMISRPKTLPSTATAGDARRVLANAHVHLVLLTEGTRLKGTVLRDDLVGVPDEAAALDVSTLAGRTIGPDASMPQARQILQDTVARRLAVVDDHGALLGLLCLKRRRTGFCSEADLASRARERDGGPDHRR